MNRNKVYIDIKSIVYNLFYSIQVFKRYKNNKLYVKGSFLKKCKFSFLGKNNTLQLGRNSRLNNCKFTFIGNNCRIIIGGEYTMISNVHFWCQDEGSSIIINDYFTMEGGHIASIEGCKIIIGRDCMFSNDVEIRNGDSHSIIDNINNRRINKSKNIYIGDHVWLTAHVRLLKGSKIPSNSIVGNSSVVSQEYREENAIYVGNPCKLIKRNVNWRRDNIKCFD